MFVGFSDTIICASTSSHSLNLNHTVAVIQLFWNLEIINVFAPFPKCLEVINKVEYLKMWKKELLVGKYKT